MNPVIEHLIEVAERDPLPAQHTSSHWLEYGRKVVVERREGKIHLVGAGFPAFSSQSFLLNFLMRLERECYRKVTGALRSHPFVWEETKKLARDVGVGLTRHEWSSAVVLSILMDHFEQASLAPRTFALIGDGDGFLGALILRCFPDQDVTLYSFDLPRPLVFQACMHERASGATTPVLCLSSGGVIGRQAGRQVCLVHPEALEQVSAGIDCAIAVVSMQEMTEYSRAAYFSFLRRRSGPDSRFYVVDRVEKRLRGGELSKFFEYPWMDEDQLFIDESCPYFRHFLDLHMYPNGPRFLGLRIPFINYYDGETWHRLVHLVPT